MQYFKGDDLEIKMVECARPLLDILSGEKNTFFDECYGSAPLGDLIFDTVRAPLANAISKDVFRSSFSDIFDAFVSGGTFESYLTVFRKIFGEDVDVEFTVPAPGKLEIDITATGLETSNFLARYIVDNEYLFDEVVDDVGDNIVFQTIKGFQSQYELEQMLFEMVPAGIYTEITLSIA